jgi:hypothetical protein
VTLYLALSSKSPDHCTPGTFIQHAISVILFVSGNCPVSYRAKVKKKGHDVLVTTPVHCSPVFSIFLQQHVLQFFLILGTRISCSTSHPISTCHRRFLQGCLPASASDFKMDHVAPSAALRHPADASDLPYPPPVRQSVTKSRKIGGGPGLRRSHDVMLLDLMLMAPFSCFLHRSVDDAGA